MKKWFAAAVVLSLAALMGLWTAAAETLDLELITYAPPAQTAPEGAQPHQERSVPIDLWMDGTANMGGVNVIEGSIYSKEWSSERLYSGGFQYVMEQSGKQPEAVSWYETLLESLPGLLGRNKSTLRVLRYDEGLYTDERLAQAGLTGDTAHMASLRRDLRTWQADADAQTFRSMTGEQVRDFYGTGAAGAARLPQVTTLENESDRVRLTLVQQQAQAAHRVALDVCDGSRGESHFLSILQDLDPDHLSLITLDTWSLGLMTDLTAFDPTEPYRDAIEGSGLLAGGDRMCTVFALQCDYVGSVTRYGTLLPQEALHWGRFTKNGDALRECAMPRCMLLFVVGRTSEVEQMSDALEALFATQAFQGERGYQEGDGAVLAVNYSYHGETFSRTAFSFAYARGDIRPEAPALRTDADETVLTLDGTETDAVVIPQNGEGGYDDHTVTVTVTLPEEAASLGLDSAAAARWAQMTLLGSLTYREKTANTPENRAALDAEGAQYTAYRSELSVFRPLSSLEGVAVSAEYDEASRQLTFVLSLQGAQRSPGYVTVGLALTCKGSELPAPEGFSFLQDAGGAGHAADGLWNVAYDAEPPASWLTLPSAVAASAGNARKELATLLRHAWSVGSERTTLGRVPDIAPVFRLLGAGELLRQVQAGANAWDRELASLTLTMKFLAQEGAQP